MIKENDTKKGFFIVLDSCNGAGKSTQIKCLKERLEALDYDVITTREPGGTPGAEQVRELLVTGDPDRWDKISEIMLFSAARRNHVETLIKPSLAAGKIVLCDRFVPSTIAYQGFGRGVALDTIKHITKMAIGDFEPDLTFLFFIDPKVGLQRAASRRGHEMRFESLDMDFHRRVQDGYDYVLREGNREGSISRHHKYQAVSIHDRTIETVTEILLATILRRIIQDQPTLIRHLRVVFEATPNDSTLTPGQQPHHLHVGDGVSVVCHDPTLLTATAEIHPGGDVDQKRDIPFNLCNTEPSVDKP